jgi:hypothetical protein
MTELVAREARCPTGETKLVTLRPRVAGTTGDVSSR